MFDMLVPQGGPSNLSPAAAGGGIGRGGTPVVGAPHQGEPGAASPAPFSGYGPAVTSTPQLGRPVSTATGAQWFMTFLT